MCPLVYPLQFGADADEYEEYAVVQTEGEHEGVERNVLQRDFVLSDEQYAVFNRCAASL